MTASTLVLRNWATPLTIGAFLLMSLTGVLMFFELDRGLVVVAHQWLSWFFLFGAGGHIVANFKPFKRHLASRLGKAALLGAGAIVMAALFSWGLITGPQLERPIEEALISAPLSSLAAVSGQDFRTLLDRLHARNIPAEGQETLRQLSALHGVDENRLLGLVFLPD